jgi:hypothetical protein
VIDSFVKDPFMLTFTIDDPKMDTDGLPASLFAPAAKPRPRPATKKKQ